MGEVLPILEDFTLRTPGSYLEASDCALTWHYRDADADFGAAQAKNLQLHFDQMLRRRPVRVTTAPHYKYMVLQPIRVTKGRALAHLLKFVLPELDAQDAVLQTQRLAFLEPAESPLSPPSSRFRKSSLMLRPISGNSDRLVDQASDSPKMRSRDRAWSSSEVYNDGISATSPGLEVSDLEPGFEGTFQMRSEESRSTAGFEALQAGVERKTDGRSCGHGGKNVHVIAGGSGGHQRVAWKLPWVAGAQCRMEYTLGYRASGPCT